MGGMVKYACDQKEESPYRDTSRRLKRIQTARFCGLCASAAVLAMAFVSHSKGLVLVWMAYCLAVHLAADVCKGKIYDGLFREEQREFQAFAGKLSGGQGGFCPDRLGFAYRGDGDDCVPVLCEFQEDRVLVLGPVLTKHFIAYISGRMIYAFTFRSTAYEPVGTLPGFSQRDGAGRGWEELADRHQKYLCAEAKERGRYLIVENFIYDEAFGNMARGRKNQPCDTVRLLSRMKKEAVYGIRTEEALWVVPQRTLERVKRAANAASNKKGGVDYVTVS